MRPSLEESRNNRRQGARTCCGEEEVEGKLEEVGEEEGVGEEEEVGEEE